MSCDGDSVSSPPPGSRHRGRAARRDSRAPEGDLHNKVLSPTLGGEEFLVRSGRPPTASSTHPSCWWSRARSRTRTSTARATGPRWATTCDGRADYDERWIDRLAPKAWRVVAIGTCATYGGIHAMAGNPTGGWGSRTTLAGIPLASGHADRERAGLPSATGQLHGDGALPALSGRRLPPMIPLDEQLTPELAVWQDRARGMRSRRLLRTGR